jgi:hypothetical protein
MLRLALGGTLFTLLTACGPQPASLSPGSAPVGTDASTGQPNVSLQRAGPGGVNRDYNIGGDPSAGQGTRSGRR